MNRQRARRRPPIEKPRLTAARNASCLHVYHVRIVPADGPRVELWFLNYPGRAALAEWCKWTVLGVYKELYSSLIEHSEWPDSLPEETSGFVDAVEGPDGPLGEIHLKRYPVINNPGVVELYESGGEGRRIGRDIP